MPAGHVIMAFSGSSRVSYVPNALDPFPPLTQSTLKRISDRSQIAKLSRCTAIASSVSSGFPAGCRRSSLLHPHHHGSEPVRPGVRCPPPQPTGKNQDVRCEHSRGDRGTASLSSSTETLNVTGCVCEVRAAGSNSYEISKNCVLSLYLIVAGTPRLLYASRSHKAVVVRSGADVTSVCSRVGMFLGATRI